MIVGVTGHRPNKMYGYDIYNEKWTTLKYKFKQLLIELQCSKAWTGMALGVDTVFALAVLELQEEGYETELCCAIPCRNHSCKWPSNSVKLYNYILSRANEVVTVSNEDYKPYLMQKRNEYIVDRIDKLIAVWDGSTGGTCNCIKYADKCSKEIILIEP